MDKPTPTPSVPTPPARRAWERPVARRIDAMAAENTLEGARLDGVLSRGS